METNLTEIFMFGHQNFISSCIKIQQFGQGGLSGCLVADSYGCIFLPMVCTNDVLSLKRIELQDVRSMNRSVRGIHSIDYKNRRYILAACEDERGDHCLVTYGLSGNNFLQTQCKLPSIQILKLSYQPLDLASSTDEKGTTVIIIFGSDKKFHVYLLDSQCILHRPKKSSVLDPLLKQLLLSSEKKNELITALPLRLLLSDYNKCVHTDILVGYSNGIINWFRESKSILVDESVKKLLQEIPLFHGHTKSIDESYNFSKFTSTSLNPINYHNERYSIETQIIEEANFDGNDIAVEIPEQATKSNTDKTPIKEKNDMSKVSTKDKSTEKTNTSRDVNKIEIKSLLFDGIACFCFYQIKLNSDEYYTNKLNDNKENKLNAAIKSQKMKYEQHSIVGLASGSCFLVCFDEVETPIRISPESHNHGGVLALALKGPKASACQDIVSESNL